MSDLFLKIINMSISAGWIVLAVLLLRFALKKAPKWVNVLLWAIVAVRLICPFSIESALSLIPSTETISPGIMMEQTPAIQTGVPAINSVVNPVIGQSFAPTPGASANPLQIWIPILAIIWAVGIAALLIYAAVSYWRLRRKVSEAVILRDNIFQSENVASPFVLGIIKPHIYLPYHMEEQDLSHVVAHEQAHIKRRDHWWKPLGFLLLTIHWFNPLMWLAYVLLCRDIELACDEKVIKELGNEQRADYTQALVACSVNRRMIAACPLAFGEVGVKDRVKSVMNYKKPAFWIVVVAVIACIVVAVCFLTNPAKYNQEICVNGNLYVQEGTNRNELPENSIEIGILKSVLHRTKDHPTEHLTGVNLDEKYPGCPIYQSGAEFDVIYLEDFGGFYIPFRAVNYQLFEAEITDMINKDNVQVFDVYPVDTDTFLAGFTTGNDLSFATFTQNSSGQYKLRGCREFGGASLYSMTIMEEQNIGQSVTVALSKREDLAKVTAQYGDKILERAVLGCPAMIVFEWGEKLPENAKVEVCFYNAAGKELERIDGPATDTTVATKWFDYLDAPDEMIWDGSLETTLPEFPGVTFRWTYGSMQAVEGDKIIELYTGMPIWSVYFCDLSGDGLPELCSALSWGSGMIDNRVMIYDYASGVSYSMEDRGNYDYYLRLNEADEQLYVDKKANMDDEFLSTGRLVFEDDCLQVLWPENQKNDFEPVYSEADNVQWSYEPKGINSDKVVELERIPEGLSWSNGIAATDVAPGEEVVSAETITVEEGETVLIHIQWSRLGLFMEYGLRSESGEEYFQEKQGGHSFLKFNGLPAGNYTIYAKNSDAYAGLPAYENPDMYDVNYDVEVLIVNYNISES